MLANTVIETYRIEFAE
ncbi:MAG: hypothetical protein B7X99_19495 [Rhizobiales bacterium 17-65-6]|nr:MAG: hypothetical protein B7X99_19495 [Rhizobiales bacterium 17-65-6]